jgi:hypothetical protein
MPKKLILFFVPLFLCGIVFYSCQKDTLFQQELKKNRGEQALISASPIQNTRVTEGLLEVPSMEELGALLDYLQTQQQSEEAKNTAYDYLGISSETREEGGAFTRNPVCKAFEQEKGYISARTKEEDANFAEAIATNFETERSLIVVNPYFKTLLNEFNAVKVGNRILKFYDEEDAFVVVANNDFHAYNRIKDLRINDITDSENVRIYGKESMEEIYQTDGEHKIVQPINDFRLQTTMLEDGTMTLQNTSCIEYADGSTPEYRWAFADGTNYIGSNPTRQFQEGEEVTITYGNDVNGWNTNQKAVFVCAIGGFEMTKLSTLQYKFTLGFGPSIYYEVRWDFGDGAKATGDGLTHTYAAAGNFFVNCQIVRLSDNKVMCEKRLPLNIQPLSCKGKTDKYTDSHHFTITNGAKFRMDVAIWVEPIVSFGKTSPCGCSIDVYKKIQVFKYVYAFKGIKAGITGVYLKKKTCEEAMVNIPQAMDFVSDSNLGLSELGDVKDGVKIPGLLSATFKCRIYNGTDFEEIDYPNKLILP